MKRQEKQTWIDETMSSLDGVRHAAPPSDLYEKSMQRIQKGRAKIVQMPRRLAWSIAARFLLLVFANIFACIQYSHSRYARQSGIDGFTNEYFAFAKPPQL